ncbi:hypothetical protein GF322_00900 [Candidatus Dependentiae bacterium]|nr:hypothetical protein [Candidatus Dependentiae bacterium]
MSFINIKTKNFSFYLKRFLPLFLILFLIWWRINTICELPKPTGSYSVGTTLYHFKDFKRLESHLVDKKEPRELLVQIWYPSDEKIELKSPYIFDILPVLRDSARNTCSYYLPRVLFDYFLTGIVTHSIPEATLSCKQQKFPVLIFSHGFASLSNFNTTQLEELASHGYVVVGINHTYDCSVTVFPDGRIIPLSNDWEIGEIRYLENSINDWIKDTIFVLDELEKLNNSDVKKKFNNHLDLSKIGMFGHSMGGATTAQICRLDSRVKAGISMDGPLFGKDSKKAFNKPFMFILAEESLKMTKRDLTKSELNYRKMTREDEQVIKKIFSKDIPELCHNIGKNAYYIVMKGAEHYTFCDFPLFRSFSLFFRYFNFGFGSIEPIKAIKIINACILDFFNTVLLHKKSCLIKKENICPEIEIKRGDCLALNKF